MGQRIIQVTTNQKYTTDWQKSNRRDLKHNTKENQQTTKEKTRRRNQQRSTKVTGKQGWNGNKYIFINKYFKCKRIRYSNVNKDSGHMN